jgi:transposase
LAATITDPSLFRSGRHLAAWLGLVPRQHSTGGKAKLGRITTLLTLVFLPALYVAWFRIKPAQDASSSSPDLQPDIAAMQMLDGCHGVRALPEPALHG